MFRKIDKVVLWYVVLLPFFMALINLFEFDFTSASLPTAIGETVLYFFRFLFSVVLVALIAHYSLKSFKVKYPWKTKPYHRLFAEIAVILLYVGIISLIALVSYLSFENNKPFTPGQFVSLVAMSSLTIGALTFAVFEQRLSAQENQQLQDDMNQMKEQLREAQLATLRHQLNPHFLFNSLNSLSNLIYENVDEADQFIREFANVYRYVLKLNNQVLVTLEDEIKFIESYIFLQKIRFKDNLVFRNEVSRNARDLHVPPFTLQILVENAIKHNEISTEHPLEISLQDFDQELMVLNSYNRRLDPEESTRVGQRNLDERFRLLSQPSPKFEIRNGYYLATVPLIETVS